MKYVSKEEEKNLIMVAMLPLYERYDGYKEAEFIRNNNLLEQYLEQQTKTIQYSPYPKYTALWKNYEEIQVGNNTYYKEVSGNGRREYYYKVLPNIIDDKCFTWKDNDKYDAKESTIISGMFEFHCIVKTNGNAVIEVRYSKCANKHRNRVTIEEIEVIDATNNSILAAIEEWKRIMVRDVQRVSLQNHYHDNVA